MRRQTILVRTASNTAGTIVRTRKTFLVARLLVGAGALGCAASALVNHIALVNGVLIIFLC